MQPLRLLLIGAEGSDALRVLRRQISDHMASGRQKISCVVEKSISSAVNRFARNVEFDALLLIPEFRGQISEQQVEQLRARFPRSQCWLMAGSWLEGETRSGKPIETPHRIYLHQFAAKLLHGRFDRCSTSSFAEATSDDPPDLDAIGLGDDTCCPREQDISPFLGSMLSEGQVVVVSELADQRAYLCDLLAAFGIRAFAVSHRLGFSSTGIAAFLVDSCVDPERTIDVLQRLRRVDAVAPAIVLRSFPRADEVERFRRAGATAVVGKPFVNAYLIAQLMPVRELPSDLSAVDRAA